MRDISGLPNVDPPTANLINGEMVDVATPGDGTGTPLRKDWMQDLYYSLIAVLNDAGITANDSEEGAVTSQFLDALKIMMSDPGTVTMYEKNDDPAVFGDRKILLQGQVVEIADHPELVANTYCGDGDNPTAPAYYKTSDAGGTTRSTAGAYFVLPDYRGLVPRGIGNATVNTRTKTGPTERGEKQEDQGQGHFHDVKNGTVAGAVVVPTQTTSNNAYDRNMPSSARDIVTDGTNGTPRTGAETRAASFGTNFAISY